MIETFRLRGDLNEHTEVKTKTFGQTLRLVQDVFRVEILLKWLSEENNTKQFVQWLVPAGACVSPLDNRLTDKE